MIRETYSVCILALGTFAELDFQPGPIERLRGRYLPVLIQKLHCSDPVAEISAIEQEVFA